jgi:phosphoribosyl 1,2-cyclic phosphodiesterase
MSLPLYEIAAGVPLRFGEAFIVKVCVLASSSSGNSFFLCAGRTRILVDAGLSRKETFARLAAIGEDPAHLNAIFVTHEHSDHVSGLPALARGLKTRPVFLTHLTAPTIDWAGAMPPIEEFQAGARFDFGDIAIQSFTIPHDAADPVGYTFVCEGIKVGLVTDLGYIPDSVKYHLQGSHLVLLESNHDLDMLKVGPYPWAVKQRVLGRKGHLSNDLTGDYIRAELPAEVSTLLLGHLSENNNHPAIVEMTASRALAERGATTRLVIVEPRKQSEAFFY